MTFIEIVAMVYAVGYFAVLLRSAQPGSLRIRTPRA